MRTTPPLSKSSVCNFLLALFCGIENSNIRSLHLSLPGAVNMITIMIGTTVSSGILLTAQTGVAKERTLPSLSKAPSMKISTQKLSLTVSYLAAATAERSWATALVPDSRRSKKFAAQCVLKRVKCLLLDHLSVPRLDRVICRRISLVICHLICLLMHLQTPQGKLLQRVFDSSLQRHSNSLITHNNQ